MIGEIARCRERVADAARPEGIPDLVNFGFDLAGYHVGSSLVCVVWIHFTSG